MKYMPRNLRRFSVGSAPISSDARTMTILVFNSGSSSLKFRLYAADSAQALRCLAQGAVSDIGARAQWTWRTETENEARAVDGRTHGEAARAVIERLGQIQARAIGAVGHRIVHGGDLDRPVRLDAAALKRIEQLSELAPLHNPPAL